jgi:hypothetical protein
MATYQALLVVGLTLIPGCLVAFDDWPAGEESGLGGRDNDTGTGGRVAASGGVATGNPSGFGGDGEAGATGGAVSSGGTPSSGAPGATGGSDAGAAGRVGEDGGADSGGAPAVGGAGEEPSTETGGSAGSGGAGQAGEGGARASGGTVTGGSAGSSGSGGATEPRQLSLGRTALSDSQQDWNPAENANDGSLATRWTAGDGNVGHWWRVDLSESHQLTRLDVTWEFSDRLYGYVVEVSADGAAWTPVLDNSDNPSRVQDQSVELEATGRFVRIRVTELDQSILTWASITEATVFGF